MKTAMYNCVFMTSISPNYASAGGGTKFSIAGVGIKDQFAGDSIDVRFMAADGESVTCTVFKEETTATTTVCHNKKATATTPCELKNGTEKDDFYGLKIDNDRKGYLVCKPTGTFVGNSNFTFLVESPAGMSVNEWNVTRVASDGSIYTVQFFTDIDSISQTDGSVEGGTLVQLDIDYIEDAGAQSTYTPLRIYVGGEKAEVVSVVKNQHVVIRTPAQSSSKSFYSGNRGLNLEYWDTQTFANNEEAITTTVASDGSIHLDETQLKGNEQNTKWTRMKFVFKAVWDGRHQLAVIAVAAPSSDENAAFVVRMAHLDTKFTNSWVGMAFDEQQRVNAESTVVLEQQTFTVSATSGSSTNEVQKVCSVTGEKTQLCLYGVCTAPAAFNAVELVAALNKLPFVETGESFTAVEADSCVTITFQSPRGNIPMMSAIGAGITITVETQGVASGDKFSFIVRCPKRFLEPVNGYYQGFETGFSDATSEVAPFCGRYSLMNKQVIYPFGSEGNRRISGKHFCFAVKGLDNNNIELSFHYDGVTRRVTTAFTTALEENTWTGAKEEDNTWKYTCLNLQTIFTERWPSLDDYSMYVLTQAKLTQNNLEKDFYVDAVLVTSAPVYSTDDVLTGQRMEIAQPGNRFRHTMNEISVVYDEANSNYVLTLTPHSCGHGFSLLNVDEAQSSAVTISSSRVTRASEPVTGTYTLSMDGISSDSIPFDATDSDIEALMAGRFGRVKVERTASSTCANMYIDIKFLDKPGDLPQMTMDGEPTKPAGATARITDRSTGHLSLWPIPGDFAYSYHTTPQIKVFVNDVPTMCSVSSGCGFAYTSDKTPTVTAITPTSGNEGDSLTITGTKFSTTNSENTVTIGGVDCSVTAATATSITCDLGNGPLETFTVDVNVAGLGKATNTAPGFQYSASNVQLTVSGVGFSSASTVTVDGVNCPVTSIDVPTTIYCTVPPNSDLSVTNDQTVAVEVTIGSSTMSSSTSFVYTALNAQITSVTPQETLSVLVGPYYAWSVTVLEAEVGQKVHWSWDTADFLNNITHRVVQIADLAKAEPLSGGISSGPASRKGEFIWEFTAPGEYHFWSGFVDVYDIKNYKMTVKVSEKTASIEPFSMLVADTEPEYKINSGVADPTDSSGCAMMTSGIAGCTLESLTAADSKKFNFRFTQCRTPTLTSVTFSDALSTLSRSATSNTIMSFSGTQFSNHDCANVVKIGDCECTVSSSTATSLDCSPNANCGYVVGLDQTFSVNVLQYGFAQNTISSLSAKTAVFVPSITSIEPTTGSAAGGTLVTIAGVGFDALEDIAVSFNGASAKCVSVNPLVCESPSSTTGQITATVSQFPATCPGTCMFTYSLDNTPTITAVEPTSVSGADTLTFTGTGFNEGTVTVEVGGEDCTPVTVNSDLEVTCDVTGLPAGDNIVKLRVGGKGYAQTSSKVSGTPSATVSPATGSTSGGTTLTFAGHGFSGETTVVAGDVSCIDVSVNSLSEITCVTESSTAGAVDWMITSNGEAFPAVSFTYDDSLKPTITSISPSSGDSLGDQLLTLAGSFFYEGVGVTVCGDACAVESVTDTEIVCLTPAKTDTSPCDVSVTESGSATSTAGTQYAFVDGDAPTITSVTPSRGGTGGGTTVTLAGTGLTVVPQNTPMRARLSSPSTDTREMQKYLFLAQRLLETAMELLIYMIVIATTGSRGSEGETEKKVISAINGQTITLADALEFMHLGVSETFTGSCMEVAHYRAEVGLLTRSVVVRGNDDAQYHSEVEKCEAGFDAGRFGDETTSSQFGAQIMCAGNDKDAQTVVCRISYTEITFAGQAFRLGRYPIHFHLNGDMSRSYAIGNAIHKTFNRAINIHGSHNLQIERNVVYNVMGGALFLEDGIETNNHYRGNLVMFVIASSSLLNDDITPACYWVTNPNNSYVDNVCAGGTHFAFWFRFHEHPEGPSATTSYWIRLVPLLKFENNSAHSFSWFGIWIFPDYYPTIDVGSKPAIFKNFFAYNNEKGIEFVNVGGVQIVCSLFVQNTKSGVEIKQVVNGYRRDINRSTGVFNSTIVGKSSLAEVQNSHGTTDVAIVLPYGDTFYVVGTTFINFDSTSAVFKTAHIDGTCSDQCGSYIYIVDGLTFDNVVYTVWFEWTNNGVIEVLDGSFPGVAAGSRIVPGGETDTGCTQELTGYQNVRTPYVPALVCEETKKFHRFAFKGVSPSSVEGKDFICENENGETRGLYRTHRLTHAPGWMLSLMDGSTYFCYFENAEHMTNISMTATMNEIDVYGKDIGKTFSLLTATATAGTSTLSVTGSEIANWSVGGEVVITSTALSPVEAETRTISAIDMSSETFNGKVVSSVCAVAYTSRTVTFMGEETETNKLGGRILVSVTTAPGTSDTLTGSANMGNAAFKNMGQDGYTDPFDPRFGLALLATGPVTDKKFSKVYGNSFMNLDSTAIGAFGVSNLDIENNLIYHSNGIGLKLGGQTENTRVRNNIAMNLLWTGSYAGRAESTNIRQEALFDLYNSIDTDLQNNFAFGSQRAGFSLPGQLCEETYKPGLPNYAIGNQIGVWIGPNDDIQQSSSQTCVRFSDFVIMKSTYWSFYYNNHYSVEFENLILAENDGTLLPMVIGPNPLGHVCGDEYVKLSNSTVIGRLPGADCSSETSPFGTYMDLSGLCMQGTGPGGALLAVLFGQITGGSNNAPEKPCGNIMSYNTLCGRMEITDTTFANFGPGSSGCKDAYAFATNPKNDDLQYYATFLNSNRINIPDSHVFYFHRPNVGKINPADCVDMDCDALKKAMIIDEDGTLIGAPATLFPESEWEWDGDPRRGLGDFRVPKDSLTTVDGDVLSVEELAEKGKGIVRNDGCELKEYSNFAYWHCEDDAWELLVMESLDADTEMRRLSPVAVIQDGYIDLINGPQDHGWCSGYTCQKRVSAFHGIVKANSGIADIYLSSTQPDKMRFFKLDGADENCVVIRFYYLNPNRIDIYTDGGSNHVLPKNGWEDDGVFKFRNEPGVDYKPTCSDAHGSNYIDRVARQLYFVLKGNTDVRLTRANVVLVSLGLPGMSEEDFFGQNIIENLAGADDVTCDEILVGETTYSPAQPAGLQFMQTMTPQHEGVPFTMQPKIRAYDSNGDMIDNLGIEESPWEITASLRAGTGHSSAALSGTVTVASENGWVNFTDLQISHAGSGYIIDFEITAPAEAAYLNFSLSTDAFDLDAVPMTAGVYSMTTDDIISGETLAIVLNLRDSTTDVAIPDITWRDHTFNIACDTLIDFEDGSLTGTLSGTFVAGTGRVAFSDWSFTGYGLVYISCRTQSTPSEFDFYSYHSLTVLSPTQASIQIEATSIITLRFNNDYDTTLPTEAAAKQLEQETIAVFNQKFPDVIITDSSSIIVAFTIEGASLNVSNVAEDICKDISSGTTVDIGGQTLTLDGYMLVDGEEFYSTCSSSDEEDGLHAAYIALIVILCLLIVGIVVFVLVYKFKIQPNSKTHDNGRTVFLAGANHNVKEGFFKQRQNTGIRSEANVPPITTLYDETPGYLQVRKSPLEMDIERAVTPTD
ncbi:PKHL1-like protein [Mya arenaria]|uniref:PKHL1-like protein n=1 Tax=Mya arenaria TaxID=6604 RepID=A0ABY7E914_MYAAR|nr:PKHL1-like protein [Mya arenaria]